MNNIATGFAPSLTSEFTIAALHPDYAPAFLDAMTKIRDGLSDHEKHYLKPLSLSELRLHAFQGNMLAAIDNGNGAIAGGLLLTRVDRGCASGDDKFQGFPHHMMSQDTAVLKIFVDKEYRGRKLMSALLESGEIRAAEIGLLDMVAKVADTNEGSRKGFRNAGFNEAAAGKDPQLGYDVHYWHKPCPALATAPISLLNGAYNDNEQRTVPTPPACK